MEQSKAKQSPFLSQSLSFLKNNFVLVAFLLLVVYSSFASKAFLTTGNIKTVLLQNSIYAICAIGQLMIIITGGIDLSVGSFVCLSVCLSAGFIQGGMGVLSIVYVMAVCAGFGMISGLLVAYAKVAPFVATLAMTSILKGLAYMYQVGQNRRIDGTFWPVFIQGNTFGVPNPVYILLFMVLLAAFLLNKTKFGRGLYAIGGNAETARLAGVSVKRYTVVSYIFGAILFSIAGMILAGRLGMGTATVGDGYETDAIASVVVGGASLSGGVGSVTKTIIGAFLIGVLTNIMNLMGIATYPQMVLKGIIIVIAVLINNKQS